MRDFLDSQKWQQKYCLTPLAGTLGDLVPLLLSAYPAPAARQDFTYNIYVFHPSNRLFLALSVGESKLQ